PPPRRSACGVARAQPRLVSRSPAFADLAALASQHHERCDGGGYHRGLSGPDLSIGSRVLAAADRYTTLVEGRPHRAALTPAAAAARLAAAARDGQLDLD